MARIGIDLIVVSYKTPNDLQGFLDSYDKFPSRIPVSLTIINNDPGPADLQVVADWQEKSLESPGFARDFIHYPTPNLFYSGAANKGAELTDRSIIGILNADTQLRENTLDRIYEAFIANPDWGVLGPLQYDEHNKVTHGGIFGTNDKPEHRGWHAPMNDRYRDVQEAVTVSGSAYFIRRSVWDELHYCETYRAVHPKAEGAFLPTPHYYEETWCSYHATAHGHKVVYFGEAEMLHKWHTATVKGGWSDQQMPVSREMFRKACDFHGISHD